MRFFRCEGSCQRFRNTRVSSNLTPESVWLMCMFLISCLFTWLCAEHFKISSGCTMLRWFFVPWNMNSLGLLLTFPPALSCCRAETSVSHLDFSGQFVAVLPLHFFESCPVPVCFLFFLKVSIVQKKARQFYWVNFGRKLPKLYWWTLIFREMFQCSRVDLRWNWLIFNGINQSVNISNRFLMDPENSFAKHSILLWASHFYGKRLGKSMGKLRNHTVWISIL